MARRKPAKTRRTQDRIANPHAFDLLDVMEGQTPGTIDDTGVPDTERCTLHDRAYCQPCTVYGARMPGKFGVDPVHWGPKNNERG